MEYSQDPRRHGGCIKFLNDYRALFIKAFLLAKRKPGQTITEILLAYTFLGFLLGMRSILDRRSYPEFILPPFRPQDALAFNGTGSIIYYYPGNTCAQTIVTQAKADLTLIWPAFPNTMQVMSDPTLASVTNTSALNLYAYIYFTNLDACSSSATMPDEVKYTLRLQENGPFYYHAQQVKISENDYLWKRSPEDFCQTNSSFANYTNQFVGVQYAVDMAIIKYVTSTVQPLSSNIFLNHFGCPAVNIDQFHSIYGFFIPIFFSIIFVVTFIINVGYIVEERQNKTKEYLRIYGLSTWVNNLVWVTRSMLIYIVLIGVVTGFSMLVLPSSGNRINSMSKSIFNYTHWTLLWTILFVYSIQVSTFSVLFGQFFKHPLMAKLLGFVLWVITFIDFYAGAPVGVRYFLCLFPNTGLLFCLQVALQYERKNNMAGFGQLYSNLFPYPLYIGLCLLLMLIYSVIYLFLAIYVERINPGEFGVAQSWNYLFKKSYWKPKATAVVQPLNGIERLTTQTTRVQEHNHWIESNPTTNMNNVSLTISHLTKKFGKFAAVSDLSLNFYRGEVSSLLGHNGAGKTTTTFILVGMLEPTSGNVTIEGMDSRMHIQDVRKILGFCPQYDILYNELSVEEHLELIGKIRHMEPKMMRESIETILHLIGLANDRQTLSNNLSGGMKRRLSIGISLIGDPKILILDEPTSGIDPYNRRMIWTIIRKMKEAGKCIILTTHFLEEADVLSDRIAIMTSGRLQANGTPDFLKNQIDFEYRLFIDKQETYPNDRITAFMQEHIPNIVLERESVTEMVYGIRRNESKQIGQLVQALDQHSTNIGVESYGLSMTTIEEVFLKLVHEAEDEENSNHNQGKSREELANRVFRATHERETGARRFWSRILALLIKRWHVFRRQYIFLFGFFLLPVLIEILIVSVLPTPNQIQVSLAQNERIKDAQVTLLPGIYNPQTIVTYANSNGNNAQTDLNNYLQSTGASNDIISTDTIYDYVRGRYLASEDVFVNKYQMGTALYYSGAGPALTANSYFSTVNYHAMATSLSIASTSLFQFYANSAAKKITTTNQPVFTTATYYTAGARFFEIVYCFDTLPLSLFNFINSVVGALFISILIAPLVQERISQSKDLQLLTNLKKRSYWLSNVIFDLSLCLLLCALLTIVVAIGGAANPNAQSEVHTYNSSAPIGYFFLMVMMYSLASLPLIYVYSFNPKSELIGFISFFILNVVGCFFNMILDFISVFSQAYVTGATGPTKLTTVMTSITWVLAVLFPTVNFKRALFNIRLKSNADCVSALNSLFFTNYNPNEAWMSLLNPGLGAPFVIFCGQMIFWWTILILIENGTAIRLVCRRCCKCDQDLEQIDNRNQWDNDVEKRPRTISQRVDAKRPGTKRQRIDETRPGTKSQRSDEKRPRVISQWDDEKRPQTKSQRSDEKRPRTRSQWDDEHPPRAISQWDDEKRPRTRNQWDDEHPPRAISQWDDEKRPRTRSQRGNEKRPRTGSEWDDDESPSPTTTVWSDAHLDEDVRNERRFILQEQSSSTSSVILVRDLVQRFKKRKEKSIHRRIYTAVDHLNFRVTKRSCFGLLGANGAGKTTTFRMLINDLKPTSGEIIINGKNINKMGRDLEVGFCPQFDWLISSLSVIEILTLFARLKGLKWSEIPQICNDMIDLFGLEAYRNRRVEKLSGGNKRKVSAVLAFMANPALVFLDEPTTGLDAAAKRKIWDVIRAARDVGLTIVMTSHSMEECEALCTKIGIMKLGQFMCLGNLQRLKNRFGNGYAARIKLPLSNIDKFKGELMVALPGIQIQEQHNGVLFCSIPYSTSKASQRTSSGRFMSLSRIFQWFNKKKEENAIESYSITQTTLEQIFVQIAGDEQDTDTDDNKRK